MDLREVTEFIKDFAGYIIFLLVMIFIFTFIIPYAFINYYPLLYFLDRTNNILYMFSPIIVIIFLIPCLLSFKIGLKHYSSAGS